jgi:hypothetical protein
VDEAFYKLIEVSIDDGDTLSSSFDVFDYCKRTGGKLLAITAYMLISLNFVKGAASTCESAAELLKCTVEKSPEVVAKIVVDTRTDSGVRRMNL